LADNTTKKEDRFYGIDASALMIEVLECMPYHVKAGLYE
jgi:hypothetical protein